MDEFDKNKYLQQLAKENADMPARPALRPIDTTDIIDTLDAAPSRSVPESELAASLRDRMGLDNLKSSMASDEDIARGLKGSMDIPKDISEEGSRMIRPKEAAKLKARENILKRMARKVGSNLGSDLGRKVGSGLGRKAAGLAIGGPLAVLPELADASEMDTSSDDQFLESTEYTPEQKQALKRGIDTKRRILREVQKEKMDREQGIEVKDPIIEKAKKVGDRIEREYEDSTSPEQREIDAMENFRKKVSNEDYIKILNSIKEANRRR